MTKVTQQAPETTLLDQALAACSPWSDGAAQLKPTSGCEGEVFLDLRAGEEVARYAVQVIDLRRREQLALLKVSDRTNSIPRLFVSPPLTPDLIEACRTLGIQFIDAAGNAYLHNRNMLVFVSGRRPVLLEQSRPRTARGTASAAALKLLFLLLSWPDEYLGAPYRRIAAAAGVALGSVGSVLTDLQSRGLILSAGPTRKTRLLEPARMLEEFALNFSTRLRPKLKSRRFRAQDPLWWNMFDPAEYRALWGGEAAAQFRIPNFRAASHTLYLTGDSPEQEKRLIVENRLRADPEGDIEILRGFWTPPEEQGKEKTVPPPLIYADLIASLDARQLEVAGLIRKQWEDDARLAR